MQFWSGEIEAKKSPKNWIWEGLGLHLGGGLAASVASLGRSWALLGRFLGVQKPAFLKH